MVENVIRFMDLDESLINEFNTTLELGNLCTKNNSFLESWQNWISWGEGHIDARCNENCIIHYYKS
jgi:hypothetical protein